MPVAAFFSAFLVVVGPLTLFMAIWGAMVLARTLFPERPLPVLFPRRAVRYPDVELVSAREIGEVVRRLRSGSSIPEQHPVSGDEPSYPIAEDLWIRRN